MRPTVGVAPAGSARRIAATARSRESRAGVAHRITSSTSGRARRRLGAERVRRAQTARAPRQRRFGSRGCEKQATELAALDVLAHLRHRARTHAPGSIASSLRVRPAPSRSAARPTASASMRCTKPAPRVDLRRAPREPRCSLSGMRAALQRHAAAEALERRAVVERARDAAAPFVGVLGRAAEHQHLAAERQRQLDEVGLAVPLQHRQRLVHLDGVADPAAERLVHVGQKRASRACPRAGRCRRASAPARAPAPASS